MSKSQATFVDEESSLFVIENQEFMAMRAAQKVWPAPTMTEDQLCELVGDGLIQSKDIAEWRAPGEHRVPAPGPGEIIHFVSFIYAGLCLPAYAFLHQFLGYFGISLNHLPPMLSFIFLFSFIFVKPSLEFLLLFPSSITFPA